MLEEFHKYCRLGDINSIKNILNFNPGFLDKIDSKLGWSPLYRSVISNQPNSVKVLIELGADPNVKNRLGESPLHQAASNNFIEIAEILLLRGADPNLSQNDGDTPLHLACTRGHCKMVSLLLSYNADPFLLNPVLCKTAFDYACENRHQNLIDLLQKTSTKPCSQTIDDSPNLTKETNFEPESEKTSRSRLGFPSVLLNWLSKYKLEEVHDALITNGYEDLQHLVSKMKSSSPLSLKTLENFGISKPGVRMRLLARLDTEVTKKPRLLNSKSLHQFNWCVNPPQSPGAILPPNIEEFLEGLGLRKYCEQFVDAGLGDYEQVLFLMRSKHPVTDELLEKAIGISKIGYRHRILAKLSADSGMRRTKGLSIEKEDLRSACECLIV